MRVVHLHRLSTNVFINLKAIHITRMDGKRFTNFRFFLRGTPRPYYLVPACVNKSISLVVV